MALLVRAMVVILVATVGCGRSGPPVGQVFGKVTFKGAPVTEGTVSFYSKAANYAADAKLDAQGGYKVETEEGGLVVGDYAITILPPIVHDSSDPRSPPVALVKDVPNIPKKYREAETSPLRDTVKEGRNELNFDLE